MTFTDTNILIKLDTLSKIWDDKKSLSISERNTKQALFLELEDDIKTTLITANSETEINNEYKQIIDIIENIKLSLDSKNVKKIEILNALKFVADNRLKIYLYTSKGTAKKAPIQYMLKLSLIKDLIKWEISKSQIKKSLPLYGNDDKNAEYSKKLVSLIDAKKLEKFNSDKSIAVTCGVNAMNFNNIEDLQATIDYLQATLKSK